MTDWTRMQSAGLSIEEMRKIIAEAVRAACRVLEDTDG